MRGGRAADFHADSKRLAAVAVPALLVALVVTNTRNAWIGAFLAVTCLLCDQELEARDHRRRDRGRLAFLVAPGKVKHRATSMFNSSEAVSRIRPPGIAS